MNRKPGTFSIPDLTRIARQLDLAPPEPKTVAIENTSIRQGSRKLLAYLESALFPYQHPWASGQDASSGPGRVELLGSIGWRAAHLVHRTTAHECPLLFKSQDCQEMEHALATAVQLVASLPEIQAMLEEDAESAYQGDPAAQSRQEVIFTYPGFYVVMVYRLAHVLYAHGATLLARAMTEIAHRDTGIDIHPGAQIGRHFFIDHGTGVVIGETAIIGSRVTLYQGVTLGAANFPRDAAGAIIRGQKRHPTLEDDVVVYSGATILGGSTVIGRGSVIGGNVWLTESVPAGTKVIAEPKVWLKTAADPL